MTAMQYAMFGFQFEWPTRHLLVVAAPPRNIAGYLKLINIAVR